MDAARSTFILTVEEEDSLSQEPQTTPGRTKYLVLMRKSFKVGKPKVQLSITAQTMVMSDLIYVLSVTSSKCCLSS